MLMRLSRILQAFLVRLISAVQVGNLLFQVIVLRLETHQGDEFLVPFVFNPGRRAFAAFTVIDLMNASNHG